MRGYVEIAARRRTPASLEPTGGNSLKLKSHSNIVGDVSIEFWTDEESNTMIVDAEELERAVRGLRIIEVGKLD